MIKKTVYEIFNNTQQKMMSNITLFALNLANICIKHDGMVFLSLIVNYDGENKIEDVADLVYGEGPDEEDVMYLYPKTMDYLIPLIEAVKEAHPEFKIETQTAPDPEDTQKQPEENAIAFGTKFEKPEFQSLPVEDDTANNDEAMRYRYLKITTAPVTKDLRKTYLKGVDSLYDVFKARIEMVNTRMKAELAPKIAGYTKEEIDEVHRLSDNILDTNIKNLQKVREQKEQEIEEGYQRYLSRHSDSNSPETVTSAAPDSAGNMLKL